MASIPHYLGAVCGNLSYLKQGTDSVSATWDNEVLMNLVSGKKEKLQQ